MKMRTWTTLTLGAAIGAAVTYLMDPDKGEQRRREAAEQARRKAEEYGLDKQADYIAGQVKGRVYETASTAIPGERSYDPKTLIRKVESEVLGHTDVPSGEVVVDADDQSVVTLRGQIPNQRLIDELVARTREVEGVRDVVNLMHLPTEPTPGTPATADVSGNGNY